jgi:oligosaccharide repeat unit polymerase
MLYQLLLLADSALWIYIAFKFAHRLNDALAWPVLFSLMYIPSYPLKALVSEYGFFVMDISSIDIEWKYLSLIIYNISAMCVVLPFTSLSLMRIANNASINIHAVMAQDDSAIRRLPLFWLACVLIGASYGVGAIEAIGSIDLLADRIEARTYERAGSGLYALVREASLVLFYLFLIANSKSEDSFRKRLMVAAFSAFFGIFSFLISGSKYQALLPIAALILLVNFNVTQTSRRFSFRTIIVLAMVGGVMMMATGYARGFGGIEDLYGVGELQLAFNQLTNAFDMPDNLAIILSRLESIWFGDDNFGVTFQYLMGWFPRFLWEDKPVIMGNLYIMQQYMDERFGGGVGEVISPSMPGEMIVSGGVIFMIVWSLFIGYVMKTIYLHAILKNKPFIIIIYIWCCLNAFNLLRSGTGVLGSLFVFSSVTLVITWALRKSDTKRLSELRNV